LRGEDTTSFLQEPTVMKKISVLIALAVLAAAPMACNKKDKGSKNPDETAEAEGDPLEELKSIPTQIQAEVDGVLKPITDVDVVVEQFGSMPSRLGIDAAGLRGMAKASFDGGEVAVNLEISAEAKAEVEALLATVKGIGTGLKEVPQRATVATKNIVALGAKAAALAAKVTPKIQAKLSSPFTKAEEKVKLQADLAAVAQIKGDIQGTVSDAKATVMGVPAKGTEALAKLTAAFAGGGSAG
jgi:hypothetical protein